jgi:hypothetical protein
MPSELKLVKLKLRAEAFAEALGPSAGLEMRRGAGIEGAFRIVSSEEVQKRVRLRHCCWWSAVLMGVRLRPSDVRCTFSRSGIAGKLRTSTISKPPPSTHIINYSRSQQWPKCKLSLDLSPSLPQLTKLLSYYDSMSFSNGILSR